MCQEVVVAGELSCCLDVPRPCNNSRRKSASYPLSGEPGGTSTQARNQGKDSPDHGSECSPLVIVEEVLPISGSSVMIWQLLFEETPAPGDKGAFQVAPIVPGA